MSMPAGRRAVRVNWVILHVGSLAAAHPALNVSPQALIAWAEANTSGIESLLAGQIPTRRIRRLRLLGCDRGRLSGSR